MVEFDKYSSGGYNFLKWFGKYTEGSCTRGGTMIYFTTSGAVAHCRSCEKTRPCNIEENERCADMNFLVLRDTAIVHLIYEIQTGTEDNIRHNKEDLFPGRILFMLDRSCAHCFNKPLEVKFLAKEKVLEELKEVKKYIYANKIFQSWEDGDELLR